MIQLPIPSERPLNPLSQLIEAQRPLLLFIEHEQESQRLDRLAHATLLGVEEQ